MSDLPVLSVTCLVYPNTPHHARRIGWDRLPEYCEGEPTAQFVIHDHVRGIFIYSDVLPSWYRDSLVREVRS